MCDSLLPTNTTPRYPTQNAHTQQTQTVGDSPHIYVTSISDQGPLISLTPVGAGEPCVVNQAPQAPQVYVVIKPQAVSAPSKEPSSASDDDLLEIVLDQKTSVEVGIRQDCRMNTHSQFILPVSVIYTMLQYKIICMLQCSLPCVKSHGNYLQKIHLQRKVCRCLLYKHQSHLNL